MNRIDSSCNRYSFLNRPSGRTLEIDLSNADMMPPSFSTRLLIENMRITPKESVLDLGAGTGVVGIAAQQLGALPITLADIVKDSDKVMQFNVARNCSATDVFDYPNGDLYAPLEGRRFDHIIANPPSIPSPGESLPQAYRSGPDGRSLHDPIQYLARYYLKAGGRLTLVHGSLANLDLSIANLESLGFQLDIAGPFENPFADFFPVSHIKTLAPATHARFFERDGQFFENRYVITAITASAYASPVMQTLERAGVVFRLLPHKRIALTVALAAAERHVPEEEMVKCILLRDKAGRFVLAALTGATELDVQRIRSYAPEVSRLSFASPEEITRITGYPLGAVSPFSLGEQIPVVLDQSIEALALAGRPVNISSGDPRLGLELAATDLIRLLGDQARIGDIGKYREEKV